MSASDSDAKGLMSALFIILVVGASIGAWIKGTPEREPMLLSPQTVQAIDKVITTVYRGGVVIDTAYEAIQKGKELGNKASQLKRFVLNREQSDTEELEMEGED